MTNSIDTRQRTYGTHEIDLVPATAGQPVAYTPPAPARVDPLPTTAGTVIKDLLERSVALIGIIVLAPLLITIALAVRLSSPGPILYRQTRVGRAGEDFTFLKFRTMVDGAEKMVDLLADQNDCDGVLFKMQRDPRTTSIGRALRRFSLDELPQLLHVLTGKMSLIGPRPALPHEVAQFDPHLHRRHAVKPGLTGLWQVSGRSDLSWDETVALDLHYVENWSLGMDARILAKTLPAVLTGRGAY